MNKVRHEEIRGARAWQQSAAKRRQKLERRDECRSVQGKNKENSPETPPYTVALKMCFPLLIFVKVGRKIDLNIPNSMITFLNCQLLVFMILRL